MRKLRWRPWTPSCAACAPANRVRPAGVSGFRWHMESACSFIQELQKKRPRKGVRVLVPGGPGRTDLLPSLRRLKIFSGVVTSMRRSPATVAPRSGSSRRSRGLEDEARRS